MLKKLSTKKLTGKQVGTLLLDVTNSDLVNLVVTKQPTTQDSLNVSDPSPKTNLKVSDPHQLQAGENSNRSQE